MFLKRSLVLIIGVLLFIGAFLLSFKMREAGIEKTFRQTREDYGVQGTVLTAAQPSFAVAAAPPPPAPAPLPASTPDPDATPPPGAAPDTNIIIGPVPPSSTPDSATAPDSGSVPSTPMAPSDMSGGAVSPTPNVDSTTSSTNTDSMPVPPAPSTDATPPAPSTDTNAAPSPAAPNTDSNSAPMTPSSTMVSPRAAIWASLLIGATSASGSPAPAGVDGPDNGQVTTTTTIETNMAPAMEAVPASSTASPTAAKTVTTNNNTTAASITTVTPAGLPPRAASASGRAIVLGYHQFTGPGVPSKNIYSMSQDVFAGEMKYLHDNGYNIVPLSQVVAFVEHRGTLPPNAVAITIDDGYKSALNYAAPVLKQYGYPWTYFVYPAFITRTEGKGAASWPDLVELGKEGVDVECHSMTHPQLSRHRQLFYETADAGGKEIKYHVPYHELTPQEYDDFLTNETLGAKAILEKELGKKIEYFAYPYGDYNQTVEAKVVAAGFEAIFTVADNPVHVTTNVHRIGRYIITKPVEKLFASYLRQGALSLAQVSPEPGATVKNPEPVITAVLGFSGDPKTIETEVRDYGVVKHDFDPATSTIRLYLPRPLIQPEVLVSIRARDVQSGQIMVANWTFNYEPAAGAPPPTHPPIGVPANEPAPGPEGTTNAASTNPGPAMPGAPTENHTSP